MGIVNFPEGYDDNVSSSMSMVDVYRAKLAELKLRDVEAAAKNNNQLKKIYDIMHAEEKKFEADVNAIEEYSRDNKTAFISSVVVIAVVSAAVFATAAAFFPVTLSLMGLALLVSMMVCPFIILPMIYVNDSRKDNKMKLMASDADLDGMLRSLGELKAGFENLVKPVKRERLADIKGLVAALPVYEEVNVQQNQSHRTLSQSNHAFFDGPQVANQPNSAVQVQRKRANSLR